MPDQKRESSITRRDFIRLAAGAPLAAAALASAQTTTSTATATSETTTALNVAGTDVLKIGVIGCGGRGQYDTGNCLAADPGVQLVAMADAFQDRLDAAATALKAKYPNQFKVTPEKSFVGLDAFQKLLQTDVDLVILTTPPGFRPYQFKAAVEAGKHVFMEKPVAVDPTGARIVIDAAKVADLKNLKVVAGTQARRMTHRMELMKRIRDGQIGDIVSGQCVRLGDGMLDWGQKERTPGMSDAEWQIRRWLFMTWLSGDFIAEMHVHELDIINWMLGDQLPLKCMGLGGREVRKDPMYGNAFDHFSVDYEYPNGVRVAYTGCQINGVSSKMYERIRGTKGTAYTDWSQSYIEGEKPFKYTGPESNPVIQQHKDHIQAIRTNTKLNEAERIANSSLVAIMGRMSAYTGRELQWSWLMKGSKLDLMPNPLALGPLALDEVAVPGKTKLV